MVCGSINEFDRNRYVVFNSLRLSARSNSSFGYHTNWWLMRMISSVNFS